MRFTPLTEAEALQQESGLWPDDFYDFEVAEATEEVSRNGNEMLHLKVWIFNKDGGRKMLHDYLVATAPWKIQQFAASCGLERAAETGTLMEGECVGRTGMCEVGIEKSDQYGDKNKIRKWLRQAKKSKPAPAAVRPADNRVKRPAGDDLNDDIPF